MTRKQSFSQLEQEYRSIFRDKLNESDDATDVEKQFSQFIGRFIQDALADKLDIRDNDIMYDPEAPTHYSVSNRLRSFEGFESAFRNSDLPNILERFAETAHNTIEHYRKLNLQGEIKLRGGPGSQYRTNGRRIAVRPGSSKRR